MRKSFLRIIALLMLLTVAATIVPAAASAAKPKLHMFMLWENNDHSITEKIENFPAGAKVYKISSSKPSVIKASFSKDGYITLKALKAGQSKIPVKYKQNGKSKTLKATYTVKKYPNAIKTLKINGKSVNLKSYKYKYDIATYTKDTMKVVFKPSSGWKVIRSFYSGSNGVVEIKSGKKFNVTSGGYINLLLINKQEEKFFYHINLNTSNGSVVSNNNGSR